MSSSPRFSALKGVQDILPPDSSLWQKVEAAAKEVFTLYGFLEIRPPIMESTTLFTRSIGETTDIVEKEMYTFPDKAGRSITLRPEGTASVVRAYVEHHLYNLPSPQKFFYSGPMFRYERPLAPDSRVPLSVVGWTALQKKAAIQAYRTQVATTPEYLLNFAKDDEIFWRSRARLSDYLR